MISETDDQAKKCNLFSFSDQFIRSSSSSPIQITVTLLFFLSLLYISYVGVCACTCVLGFHSFLQFQFVYDCSSSLRRRRHFFLQKIFIRIKHFSTAHTHTYITKKIFFINYYLFDVVVQISSLNSCEFPRKKN